MNQIRLSFLILASCAAHSGPRSVLPAPLPFVALRPPLLDHPNWSGGSCWSEERKFSFGSKFFIVYDYTNHPGTKEVIVPRFGKDEFLLHKECNADATVVLTNKNLFVLPGGLGLLVDPPEDRTFWGIEFDSPLAKAIQAGPLKFILLFTDGTLCSVTILPDEKDTRIKKIATVNAASDMHIANGVLHVDFGNKTTLYHNF